MALLRCRPRCVLLALYTRTRFYIKGIAHQTQGLIVCGPDIPKPAGREPSTFIDNLRCAACMRALPPADAGLRHFPVPKPAARAIRVLCVPALSLPPSSSVSLLRSAPYPISLFFHFLPHRARVSPVYCSPYTHPSSPSAHALVRAERYTPSGPRGGCNFGVNAPLRASASDMHPPSPCCIPFLTRPSDEALVRVQPVLRRATLAALPPPSSFAPSLSSRAIPRLTPRMAQALARSCAQADLRRATLAGRASLSDTGTPAVRSACKACDFSGNATLLAATTDRDQHAHACVRPRRLRVPGSGSGAGTGAE
ncbi:hypothetical protein B0H17DRAFT_1332560 [Mycena rosella]|uniref:Uncharacterized protein n=1 Tax=Mycena rosella TaxID=1033263 RepID=A0AAD7DAP2_MYCRO|nr:hypothetical protein B0H17DRAFT_1332560 [Mycena rosella]